MYVSVSEEGKAGLGDQRDGLRALGILAAKIKKIKSDFALSSLHSRLLDGNTNTFVIDALPKGACKKIVFLVNASARWGGGRTPAAKKCKFFP